MQPAPGTRATGQSAVLRWARRRPLHLRGRRDRRVRHADATPASRSFSVASSGPSVTIGTHPPAAQIGSQTSRSRSRAPSRTPRSSAGCHPRSRPPADWDPCDPASGARYAGLADGRWSFEVRAEDPQTQAWSTPPAEWLVRVDTAGPGVPPRGRARGSRRRRATRTSDSSRRRRWKVRSPASSTARPTRDCSDGTFSVTGLRKGEHRLRITASDALGNIGRRSWCGPSTSVPRGSGSRDRRIGSRPCPMPRSACGLEDRPLVVPVLVRRIDRDAVRRPAHARSVARRPSSATGLVARRRDEPLGATDASVGRRHDPARLAADRDPRGGRDHRRRRRPRSTSGRASRERLFCSLDGADFAPCTTPVVYSGLLDGPHAFEVYVQDRAGNVSITASRTWTVDAVP